jgi:NAD(P)-dependent dehydrogenase (short-subunit alcohol dehydrogenase family)
MDIAREKVVIITGGSGLLGKAFSKACADTGYSVVIADINDDLGKKTASDITESTGNKNIRYQYCDITNSADVKELITYCTEEFGTISALVNNAYPRNKNYGRIFEEVTYEDFCENVCMHMGGYFNISKWVAREMMTQKSGNIINMASIYGFAAPRFDIYDGTTMTMPVEYAAIKGGILNLTKYLASYLGKYNIRVNAISPGGIEDRQTASFIQKYSSNVFLGERMAQPADIMGVLLFLISDQARYITGQNIIVDGGWTL